MEPYDNLETLANVFDLGSVSRSSAKFDPSEIGGLNARIVHELSFDAVKDRLAALGVAGGEDFWNVIRGNCAKVQDAAQYWQIINAEIKAEIDDEDLDFLKAARRLFPDGDVTAETWGAWTNAVKSETGRKGRGLFMPLRRALTGLDHGPDMKDFLPFIGRQNSLARLPE